MENLSVLGALDENSKLKRREKLQSTTRSRDALKSGGSGSLSDPWLGVEPSRDSEGRSRGLILTETKDILLAEAQQKISLLKAKLEAVRPVKRKRVILDPNELLVSKKNVYEAQENNRDCLEDLNDGEEVSEPGEPDNDCIIVR